MKQETVKLLRSPETNLPFKLEVFKSEGAEIMDGRLIDESTGDWFRIENGIADLLPLKLRRHDRYVAFAQKHSLPPPKMTAQPAPEPEPEPVKQAKHEHKNGKNGKHDHSEHAHEENYQEQIDFFDRYHQKYEDQIVESPFYRVLDAVTIGSWMSKTLAKGKLVADIGSGSGRQAVPLVENGNRVIGFDISEEMLTLARAKIVSRGKVDQADFVVATAECIPLAANAVDAAVIYGSLHHFSHPEVAIREVGKILSPGGQFYMMEPHDTVLRGIFEWSMKVLPLWEEEAHDEPQFTSKQWQEWLGAAQISAQYKYGTFLPPHLFYAMPKAVGKGVMRATDGFFGALPGIRKVAGVLIAKGTKAAA